MPDLDRLREVGQLVRQPVFDDLLVTRRRRTRQAQIAAAAGLTAAVALAIGALAVTGGSMRSDRPPVAPNPSPTTTKHFERAEGQRIVVPDIRSGDVQGFKVLSTVTNTQTDHRDESELSATVTVHTEATPIAAYCRGASDLWYIYDRGDGGGGMDHCSPDADPEKALAPAFDITESTSPQDAEQMTVRLWIVRPSAAWIDCLHSSVGDCNGEYGTPAPISDPNVEFGFRIFEHQAERPVLTILEDPPGDGSGYVFEALSSVDGVAWLVDRSVTPAPETGRVAFQLPPSEAERLIDVYTVHGPHLQRCAEQHEDELPDDAYFLDEPAIQKVCGVMLRLLVDGSVVTRDRNPYTHGHFTELGARLTPGTKHDVEVEIVRGDSRNIRYAVVVRTRTEMP